MLMLRMLIALLPLLLASSLRRGVAAAVDAAAIMGQPSVSMGRAAREANGIVPLS